MAYQVSKQNRTKNAEKKPIIKKRGEKAAEINWSYYKKNVLWKIAKSKSHVELVQKSGSRRREMKVRRVEMADPLPCGIGGSVHGARSDHTKLLKNVRKNAKTPKGKNSSKVPIAIQGRRRRKGGHAKDRNRARQVDRRRGTQ